MSSGIHKKSQMRPPNGPDPEVEMIERLYVSTARSGARVARIDIANSFVALKHRPMVILAGPSGTRKGAFVKSLAEALTGDNEIHRQISLGHAWYAGGGTTGCGLVDIHSRLLTEKSMSVIEEAWQPQNVGQVFVLGLTRISPAELLSFFTEVAYQIQHSRIMRLGNVHLTEAIPFPPNLLILGTMDTPNFEWWDRDLLAGATVIEWSEPGFRSPGEMIPYKPDALCSYPFSSLRTAQAAYGRLFSITASIKRPLKPVMLVQGIFQKHGLEFSPALFDEIILYLANAWSWQGHGLLDPHTPSNLSIACDLAVKQLVLPGVLDAVRTSEHLQADLRTVLGKQLPRSFAFLKHKCKGQFIL